MNNVHNEHDWDGKRIDFNRCGVEHLAQRHRQHCMILMCAYKFYSIFYLPRWVNMQMWDYCCAIRLDWNTRWCTSLTIKSKYFMEINISNDSRHYDGWCSWEFSFIFFLNVYIYSAMPRQVKWNDSNKLLIFLHKKWTQMYSICFGNQLKNSCILLIK